MYISRYTSCLGIHKSPLWLIFLRISIFLDYTFLAITIIPNIIVSSFNLNVTLSVIGGDLIVLYLYIYSIQSALKARQAAQVEVFCWSHGTFVYIDKFMRAITNKCQIYYLYHLNPCYKDLNGYKLWAIYVYTRRIRKIKCIIYNQTIKNRSYKIFQNNFKHRHIR